MLERQAGGKLAAGCWSRRVTWGHAGSRAVTRCHEWSRGQNFPDKQETYHQAPDVRKLKWSTRRHRVLMVEWGNSKRTCPTRNPWAMGAPRLFGMTWRFSRISWRGFWVDWPPDLCGCGRRMRKPHAKNNKRKSLCTSRQKKESVAGGNPFARWRPKLYDVHDKARSRRARRRNQDAIRNGAKISEPRDR